MYETLTIQELPHIEAPMPEQAHTSREDLERLAAAAALEGFEPTGPAGF